MSKSPLLFLAACCFSLPVLAADDSGGPDEVLPDSGPPPTAAKAAPAETKPPVPPPLIAADELKPGQVRIEILEEAPAKAPAKGDAKKPAAAAEKAATWSSPPTGRTDEYAETAFAFADLVQKYDAAGIRQDRSAPFLVRSAAVVTLPAGEHRLLVRSLSGARLAVDGQALATTEMLKQKGGDNEPVPDQARTQLIKEMRLLPAGHREALAKYPSDGQPHVFTLEVFVGGKAIRPEIGETSVSVSVAGAPFALLAPVAGGAGAAMTDAGWKQFATAQQQRLALANADRRHNDAELAYWRTRHEMARQHAPAAAALPGAAGGEVDRFVAAGLSKGGAQPSPIIGDAAFLRRATLDTIGLLPTSAEVDAFLKDKTADKRARAIDRLLADARWADRWVPYWQDVLAENPALLKGSLANTGPFRHWIYEALLDNKPMDRFATELITMGGSAQNGGPSGFAISSQNDLPMAAKAQIVGSAFLAMEMKCARCHDAPYHPFNQEDLFNLAAMLQRAPLKVPGSSLTKGLSANSHVQVSLKPGQEIAAHWPFKDFPAEPLPGVIRSAGDTREQLAAILTDPRSTRFPQVIVNRLWKEFIGVGIVDPVEDWENTAPSDPALIAWLARELVTHDYDLKHVARLILNSQLYQRTATASASRVEKPEARLFAAPARRRMNAEQLVDSLFTLAGKEFDTEALTMDPEDRQPAKDHSNLGTPRRAWQFAGLGNERDRPALAKPRAQVITDVLATFGWRESRAEPRTVRDHDANVLQPASLANGVFGACITRLDEASAFTELALQEQPLPQLVRELFLRILSREPSAAEEAKFRALLEPGFAERRTGASSEEWHTANTKAVSWSNHLNPEATVAVLAVEKEVKAGAPPTKRLQADWRERMEDTLCALMLSPEMIHLP